MAGARHSGLAIADAFARQHAVALHLGAGLVLDQELAEALITVGLVADLGIGRDAGHVIGRRADRLRLEDAGLLGAGRKSATVLGEVLRRGIEQPFERGFAA